MPRKLKYNMFVKLSPTERAMLRAAMSTAALSNDWGIKRDALKVLSDLDELMYGGPA